MDEDHCAEVLAVLGPDRAIFREHGRVGLFVLGEDRWWLHADGTPTCGHLHIQLDWAWVTSQRPLTDPRDTLAQEAPA